MPVAHRRGGSTDGHRDGEPVTEPLDLDAIKKTLPPLGFWSLTGEKTIHALIAEVERLRAALQRIADEYGDCRCEHDDEHCCALVQGYCCPSCIAVVALRSAP